jgi:hypothetical protein
VLELLVYPAIYEIWRSRRIPAEGSLTGASLRS